MLDAGARGCCGWACSTLFTLVFAFAWFRADGKLTIGVRAGYVYYGLSAQPVYYNSRFERGGADFGPCAWTHVQRRRIVLPTVFWNTQTALAMAPERAFVTIPLWIPAAALLGLLALNDWRRSRVIRGGCGNCGYPRAGLAHGAPCPECGTVPRAQVDPQRLHRLRGRDA